MKDLIFILVTFVVTVSLIGCAEIRPPSPAEVLSHPLGKGPLEIGMRKAKVVALWGEPDDIVGLGTNKWGAAREKWIYRARYSKIPIDAGILSKAKYLYFEGDVLTRWED